MPCVQLATFPIGQGLAERRGQIVQQRGGRFAAVQHGQAAGVVRRDDQPAGVPRSTRERSPIENAQLFGAVAQDEVARLPSGRDSESPLVCVEPQPVDLAALCVQPGGEIFEQGGLAAPVRSRRSRRASGAARVAP